MYGKLFEQTFTGSMCGKGPVAFAVWSYIIANTKADHMVEVNPRIVATVIGCPEIEVVEVLKLFCSPDKESRNKEHGGRKLLKRAEFLYFVTGHQRFRECKNEDGRKDYMRQYMQQRRARLAKERKPLTASHTQSTYGK